MSSTPHPAPLRPSACEGLVTGLVVRSARGETAALGVLFDLTYGLVAATLRRRLPVPTLDADLDDLVVEVFHEVWRSAPSFRPGRHDPLSWLLGIADAAVPATGPALVAS